MKKIKTSKILSIIFIFILMTARLTLQSQIPPSFFGTENEEEALPYNPVSGPDQSLMQDVLLNAENGWAIPVKGTFRILIVFAEKDCGPCGGSGCFPYPNDGAWPPGQLPNNTIDANGNDVFKNTWFDQNLISGQQPTSGNLTDYYYQMSMGQYIVLGDYYPEIIKIPCTSTTSFDYAVMDAINAKTLINGSFSSKHGLTLADFDSWGNEGDGEVKTNNANYSIDGIVIVKRNTTTNSTSCSGGNGLSYLYNYTLKQNATQTYTIRIGSQFQACDGSIAVFINEYFHAMFGHNNWHSGGGAGNTTFLTYPGNYSMTSYSAVGNLACAYDRHRMGWYGWKNNVDGIRKDYPISVKTATQDEVPSDFDISTTFPNGNEFILRDFVTYGDAIRIKLPYINWTADGDVKNQYLWLENHQKISSFDKSAWEPSTCKESWSKGIYAYIQVGKNIKESTSADDLFGATHYGSIYPDKPNGLGSWLFPLTAEGNYDFKYWFDLFGTSSDNCVWDNNEYLPKEKNSSDTKPNPFTGMSDLFEIVDFNNYGNLLTAGAYQPWTAEIINGGLFFTAYAAGDSKDAFKCNGSCPKKIFSLGTNPAPLPVYTYQSNGYSSSSGNTTWENRTIWLNGISIEILGENIDGNGAVKVKVRFDDYKVNNDVRWCGDIKLSPNYQNPNLSNYALNLMQGKTILIDRGKSPTQHKRNNIIDPVNGDNFFTQPTIFTVLPNAFFHTEINSIVTVDNGSTLKLESGSKYEVNSGSILRIRSNSTLVIEQGSELKVNNGGKVIIESTAKLEYNGGSINLVGTNSILEIIGILQIGNNTTFNISGSGYIDFKNTGTTPNILGGTNSKFELTGTGKDDLKLKVSSGATLMPANNLTKFSISNAKIINIYKMSIGCPYTLFQTNFTNGTNAYSSLITINEPKSSSLINGCEFNYVHVVVNQTAPGTFFRMFASKMVGIKLINDVALYDVGLKVNGGSTLLLNDEITNFHYAYWHNGMTNPSVVKNCKFLNSKDYAILCTSSALTSLTVTSTDIHSVDAYGVDAAGIAIEGTTLNLRCSKINGLAYGIIAGGGSTINMSTDINSGYNDVSGNTLPMYLQAANILNLNNGYNKLGATASWQEQTQDDIFGTLISFPLTLDADKNQWYYNNSWGPGNTTTTTLDKTNIKKYGGNLTYIVKDDSPHMLATCGSIVNPPNPNPSNPLEVCASCTNISTSRFSNVPYNEAVRIAISNMETEDSTMNDLTAIAMFKEILLYPVNLNDPTMKWLSDLAFAKMNIALSNTFATGRITAADNRTTLHQAVLDILAVYAKFSEAPTETNYLNQFYLDYAKAQIYRLAGRSDSALVYFSNISNCYIGSEEIRQLDNAKLITSAEDQIIKEQISIQYFDSLLTKLILPIIKKTEINSTANINNTAILGENVKIGANTVIEQSVIIGNNVTIGNNVSIKKETTIKDGVTIGNNTVIEKGNIIGADNIIGSNVIIKKECVLANNVTLSDNAGIEENSKIGGFVTIGLNTKLQKEAYIADGTSIGANGNFDKSIKLGSNVTILDNANVKKEVQVNDRTFIGSNVTINQTAKIGSDVTINNSISIGSNTVISNNKIVTANVANNVQVGTTTPTTPAIPGQVVYNCTFAQANAKVRGNLFYGFTATNENTGILSFGTGNVIKYKPNNLSLNYLWNFGDCTTSTEQSPSHSYTKPGVYVITLTETVKCTQVVYTGAITVYPVPNATFTNQQLPICSTINKYLFNISNNVGDLHTILYNCQTGLCSNDPTGLDSSFYRVKYHWNFGQVKPALDETFTLKQIYKNIDSNITCTFPQARLYPVSLSATLEVKNKFTNIWTATDITKVYTDTINVGDHIMADFEFTQPSCFNDSVHFTNKTMYGKKPYTYSWSFAFHSGSTLENPVHKYSSAGIYNTSLIATDVLGCKDTIIKQIIIPACPSIFGTVYENEDCGGSPVAGDTIVLKDNSGNIISTITPAITNSNGEFNFSSNEIQSLDTTLLFILATKSGFALQDVTAKTISQWISESPLTFSLLNVNKVWEARYSAPDSIYAYGRYLDKNENIFVIGSSLHTWGWDVVTLKYNSVGILQWNAIDIAPDMISYSPTAIIVDSLDNVYTAGIGSDLIGSNYIIGFISKYSSSGILLWKNTLPQFQVISILIDKSGNVYVGGINNLENYTVSEIKYNSNGVELWRKDLGVGQFWGQAFDNSGNLIVNYIANGNNLLVKIDFNSNILWSSSYIFGSNLGYFFPPVIDSYGNIFTNAGGNLLKYKDDGTLLWIHPNICTKILVDANDDIITLSNSKIEKYSNTGVKLWEVINDFWSGVADKESNIYALRNDYSYLEKYNSSGNLVWSVPYSDLSWADDLVISKNDNIYLGGEGFTFNGVDWNGDIFTAKFSQCPSAVNVLRYSNPSNNNSTTNNSETYDNRTTTNDNRISIEKEYVNMFPNPNDGNFYFNYSLPENEKCQFAAFDPTGKKVYSIEIKGGKNTVMVNHNNFSNGVYYYQVTAGNRLIKTERLVIAK